jgi:hypothetical protein
MKLLLDCKRLVLASLLLRSLAGCVECDSDYIDPSYRIVVVNAATGERLCDATVSVVSELSGAQPVTSFDCSYIAKIPVGTEVTIEAARDGFVTATQVVSTSYETDECYKAIETPVQLDLTPA